MVRLVVVMSLIIGLFACAAEVGDATVAEGDMLTSAGTEVASDTPDPMVDHDMTSRI
jgi:hypothetical protein